MNGSITVAGIWWNCALHVSLQEKQQKEWATLARGVDDHFGFASNDCLEPDIVRKILRSGRSIYPLGPQEDFRPRFPLPKQLETFLKSGDDPLWLISFG